MGPRTTRVGVLPALAGLLLGACGDTGGVGSSAGSGVGRGGAGGEAAASTLRAQRTQARDLLADLARALVAPRRGAGRAEMRGTYEGCTSDAVAQGYRSWTYAGGGRITGDATLTGAERALADVGAHDLVRTGHEVRGQRQGVEVAVTRHRGALVVAARARPCTEVPAEQQEAWLDREGSSGIPVDQPP
jgi:hypothetical protein